MHRSLHFIFLGENPGGVHLFWDLLRVPPLIGPSVLCSHTTMLQMTESKGCQWWFKNCHFAIQRQFLQVWDKRASPFHKRHVIHQQVDLKASWRDNTALFTTTLWYGLYLLWSANIISFVVFSISQFPEVIKIPRGLNELTPTIKHCNKL